MHIVLKHSPPPSVVALFECCKENARLFFSAELPHDNDITTSVFARCIHKMIKKKTILKYAFDLKKKTISNNFVKQWPSATAIYISIVVWNHYCPNDYFRYNDLIKLNTVLTHNIWILPSNKNTLHTACRFWLWKLWPICLYYPFQVLY